MSYKRFVGLSKEDVDTIQAVLKSQAERNMRFAELDGDESSRADEERVDLRELADSDLERLVPILTLMLTER